MYLFVNSLQLENQSHCRADILHHVLRWVFIVVLQALKKPSANQNRMPPVVFFIIGTLNVGLGCIPYHVEVRYFNAL